MIILDVLRTLTLELLLGRAAQGVTVRWISLERPMFDRPQHTLALLGIPETCAPHGRCDVPTLELQCCGGLLCLWMRNRHDDPAQRVALPAHVAFRPQLTRCTFTFTLRTLRCAFDTAPDGPITGHLCFVASLVRSRLGDI